MVQPCIWFKEEPSQFFMGQTAQSLICSIMEKPRAGLDECSRILLACFRARNSACRSQTSRGPSHSPWHRQSILIENGDFAIFLKHIMGNMFTVDSTPACFMFALEWSRLIWTEEMSLLGVVIVPLETWNSFAECCCVWPGLFVPDPPCLQVSCLGSQLCALSPSVMEGHCHPKVWYFCL